MTDPASQDAPAVVVDTMVFGWTFLGGNRPPQAARYDAHLTGRRLVLSTQTVAELRYGALRSHWGDDRRAQLEERIARVAAAPIDDQLATVCAELRDRCRQLGHPLHQKVHDGDRWIAATAIRYGIPLVSDDTGYIETPGLELIIERSGDG